VSDEETKLVVYTIVVRVPKELTTWGDVYGVQTKYNYWGGADIVEWTNIEIES